jgi:hypothetical protein
VDVKITLFPLALCLLLTGCSENTEDAALNSLSSVVELTPAMVIGSVEYSGEDCFAAISDAEFTPAGDIAVLDRVRGCAAVFSRSGEYLCSLGRSGSGPGEFASPDFITTAGSSTVVFERNSGKASMFSADGTYEGELCDAAGIIPVYCTAAGESRFAGGVSARDPRGSDMDGVYMVIVFDSGLDPVDTLYTHHYTLEYGNFSNMLRNTNFSCSFDCDDDGNIFIAPCSCEEFRLMGFDSTGTQFLNLAMDVAPVERSAEEIALEEERFNSLIRARINGFNGSFEALEYRYVIPPNGVHADDLGRLWVRNGLVTGHEFLVYDYQGSLLFTVEANGIDTSETNEVLWWSVDEYGLLCFSMDPREYPAVYFYAMPDV